MVPSGLALYVRPTTMKRVELNHYELRSFVKFTDPLMLSYEKLDAILHHVNIGDLRAPYLIKHGETYFIFNGNHRVLVAINNELTIYCKIIENINDVEQAQIDEGDDYRDVSMISPFTFNGVLQELKDSAEKWAHQNPEDYDF